SCLPQGPASIEHREVGVSRGPGPGREILLSSRTDPSDSRQLQYAAHGVPAWRQLWPRSLTVGESLQNKVQPRFGLGQPWRWSHQPTWLPPWVYLSKRFPLGG